MTAPVLAIDRIAKRYKTDFWKKTVQALDDVSFEVGEGQVFGLVGHNGAGKTTLIKILIGLVRPSAGAARVFGEAAGSPGARQRLGYLPEAAYYYDFLRADEVLRFYAGLFGYAGKEADRRVDEMLDWVGLSDRRELRLRYFSKGMLQRIGIAQALINDPALVVMDEPMSGLDPLGRKEVRDIILELKSRGKTIVFSSHILPDVEALCDHVAILAKGRLKAAGLLSDLVRPRTKSVELLLGGRVPAPEGFDLAVRATGADTMLVLRQPERLDALLRVVVDRGVPVLAVQPHRETLEDLYVETSGATA